MDINSASVAITEHAKGEASVNAASTLSAQERIFCEVFVGNGGKAGHAARAAGYADASADVTACKLLCRPRVAAQIKHHCETFAHTALPVAIKTLLDACSDEKALWKDRIKAANSLGELAGMTAPHGGVQVNVGVQVNGQQAQALISSVWEAKRARLSDIPPAMSDTLREDMQTIEQLAIGPPADQAGGDQLQGSVAGTCPLPAPSSANAPKSRVSCECVQCRDKPAPDDDGFEVFDRSQGEG